MKPVRFDAEAKEELIQVIRYYEIQRRGLGTRLLKAVRAVVERIRREPFTFAVIEHVRGHFAIRRALVEGFPYALPFLELSDHLRILAVAHQHRRPGYWRERT